MNLSSLWGDAASDSLKQVTLKFAFISFEKSKGKRRWYFLHFFAKKDPKQQDLCAGCDRSKSTAVRPARETKFVSLRPSQGSRKTLGHGSKRSFLGTAGFGSFIFQSDQTGVTFWGPGILDPESLFLRERHRQVVAPDASFCYLSFLSLL